MSAPVVFIDTETLGHDADIHPIWEVAVVTSDGSERVWQLDLTPRQMALAHPKALEIGRFEERYDIEAARSPRYVAEEIQDLTVGCHIAGAVISFDEERLRRLMWKYGLAPEWHYHIIDVEALAVGYLAARDGSKSLEPPWDSSRLTEALGLTIDETDKHTALGDARWAKAIYEAVMGA